MPTRALLTDPALKRFHAALRQAYGDRLERTILFGSRARGDARPESDYDIAVFLRDMPDRFAELDRLARIGTDVIDTTGEVINALAYQAGAYNQRTPLMREIRRDGIEL